MKNSDLFQSGSILIFVENHDRNKGRLRLGQRKKVKVANPAYVPDADQKMWDEDFKKWKRNQAYLSGDGAGEC